jgi:hypothetical protein
VLTDVKDVDGNTLCFPSLRHSTPYPTPWLSRRL